MYDIGFLWEGKCWQDPSLYDYANTLGEMPGFASPIQ